MVYEMEKNRFTWDAQGNEVGPPHLKPENIEHYLEVGHVGMLDKGLLHLHTDPLSDDTPQVRMIRVLCKVIDLKILFMRKGSDSRHEKQYKPSPGRQ